MSPSSNNARGRAPRAALACQPIHHGGRVGVLSRDGHPARIERANPCSRWPCKPRPLPYSHVRRRSASWRARPSTNSNWANVFHMVLLILLVVFAFDSISGALRTRLTHGAR